MQQYLCIGIVAKPQGIRGELKIVPYTDDISRFGLLKRVYFKENETYVCYPVTKARYNDNFGFLKLNSINDMDTAQRFREQPVYVIRQDAAKLPQGRYYIADLIGCSVYDTNDQLLGKVDEILQNSGNDVYVVLGARTLLFPAIHDLFVETDVENSKIVVDAKRLSEVAVYED